VLAHGQRLTGLGQDRAHQAFDFFASRRGGSTTRFTRPRIFASAAVMNSPVTNISMASLGAMLRTSGTLGVAQNRPASMPLTPKRAVLTATARSHCATSWQPAAVARPWTRAITGTGSC
jgi:hypothetical protein